MEFQNKTALVTGAASGMALLFCQCFVKEGGNAVMADINEEALAEKVAEINKEYPGRAIGVKCDVTNYESVTACRDKAVEVYGSIDVMVNLAGGAELRMLGIKETTFHKVPIEVYDWGMDVNLKGQFYFCHAVMAQMAEQKSGVIINIGSITGEEGCGGNVAYSTSKSAAMNGLTKSVALAGAPYNVRCVCVAPGPVLTRAAMANMKTLCGRAAEPQEMVDLMMYLASDKASFINGIYVLADGGRNIMRNKS